MSDLLWFVDEFTILVILLNIWGVYSFILSLKKTLKVEVVYLNITLTLLITGYVFFQLNFGSANLGIRNFLLFAFNSVLCLPFGLICIICFVLYRKRRSDN